MIGIDIIEISRIETAVKQCAFIKKVFTSAEQAHYKSSGGDPQTYAGMFAAKEAVVKALQTGFDGIRHTDVEVRHSEKGAPYIKLYGAAAEVFKASGKQNIEISISHCESYAAAVCNIF